MRPMNSSVCVICWRSARTTPTAGGPPGAGWAWAETGSTLRSRATSLMNGLDPIVSSIEPHAVLSWLTLYLPGRCQPTSPGFLFLFFLPLRPTWFLTIADIGLQRSDARQVRNRRAVLCYGHGIRIAHAEAYIFRHIGANLVH